LRGLAAVFVVLYHYVAPSRHTIAFGHGYLAVDFFFVLSGFVICHVYEDRLRSGMSLVSFGLRRVIRLYPLVFISGLGAGVLAVLQHALWGLEIPRWSSMMLATVLLPDPLGGQGDLFPLNSPLWSLFLEMVVNLLYAAFALRLSNRRLGAISTGMAIALIAFAWRAGTLDLGSTGATLFPGVLRTASSFGIGVLIGRLHKSGHLPAPRVPLVVIAILLAATFAAPRLSLYNCAFDVAAAYFLFPAAVIGGLSAQGFRPSRRLAHVAGELSYPLYVVHFPLRTAIQAVLAPVPLTEWVSVFAQVAIAVCVSWVALKIFDRPLRTRLLQLAFSPKRGQRS
jgi:peptidoglycan/LPS O-acetylase OafA/YrhL